ncbi:hypothetical protein [Nocardia sp. CA-290969]|uniref:hypothetical protein n=1 Tax=Nocardia sp. CA-290969 TaxID=3239986 RepID=UPI003D8E7829
MPEPREALSLDGGEYDPAAYADDDRYEDQRYTEEPPAREEPRDRPRRPIPMGGNRQQRRARQRERSRIPAHAPQPQDHRAPARDRAPVQREAEDDGFVSVEFDGRYYEIPAEPLDWPLDAAEAFEQGKATTAIHALLGDVQWAKLRLRGYRLRDFNELFDRLARAGGFDTAGN